MQGTAAGAHEHEFARMEPCSPLFACLQRQVPAAVGDAFDVGDLVAVVDLHAVVAQIRGQLAGQRTEVDVGAVGDAGGRDALLAGRGP